MRIVTKEYNVYKYNELSDEAKEVAKKWYLDTQESEIFTNICLENLNALFPNNDLKVQYSLNCSQGDGFNVYGSIGIEDIYNFIQNNKNGSWMEKYVNIISDDGWKILFEYAEYCDDIKIPYNRHYWYCMADRIDISENWYDTLNYELDYIDNEYIGKNKPMPDCFTSIDIDLLDKFENLVKGIFKTLCNDYEDEGYKYFYEIDDDTMNDICCYNEYEFFENGNFFNELTL